MIGNSVSRRYANELFSLGSQAGGKNLDTFSASLECIQKALNSSESLQQVMTNPTFTVEEKKSVIMDLSAKMKINKSVSDFWLLIAEKNRMQSFDEIVLAFRELLDDAKGVLRGTLITAVPLNDEKQQKVLADLQTKTNKTLAIEFSVAKEILGGVILKVGDYVRDASLRTQLSILKESIKKGK